MGSKRRISKEIIPIMLEYRGDRVWVEPFVGGGNSIDKVSGRRIGSDINKYTISGLISIRDFIHELPKNNLEFTEQDYRKLKYSDDYKHKGYAGYSFSYGGKWLGGWLRDSDNKRDYVNESYRNSLKQTILLQDVELINESFIHLSIPENSLIYCDPPYFGTTSYSGKFDHNLFFDWCREMKRKGHEVFVSEYNAPDDFECIWSKELRSSLTRKANQIKNVEKLFRVPG